MTTSWRSLGSNPALNGLRAQTTDPHRSLLYQWGTAITFEVWPLNVYEFDHETDTDWAEKEIAGAAIWREWVGENNETIYFRGRLFPYRIGGFSEIEMFEAARRNGVAGLLMRGGNPSTKLGWFVCEKLVRSNTFLSGEGIGQQIAFEAQLTRVPTPAYQENMLQLNVAIGALNVGAAP